MKKTILITGASSGIGKATAKYFQARGWNVVATMRNPGNESGLQALKNVSIIQMGVTDTASIRYAVEAGINQFGKIDVLLNNAGFGAANAGAYTPETIAEVIYGAATDGTDQLRYTAGKDAEMMVSKRKAESDEVFLGDMKAAFSGKAVAA